MDVGGWLRGLGLGQYEGKFRDNKIDADLLPRLTVDDLKDIGVSVVGDRRRLLDAIAVIAGAGPPADVPASPRKSAPSKGLEASAERRPITVMFCDLVGSTSMAAKLDAEDWRTLVNTYLDEASAAVTGLGGHVLKKLGDGLMALFGYPHAQENDAERAVRAALAIQRALVEINARNASKGAPELSARIGLDSGQVVVDATGEVFGDAPNIAARVQGAAEPGSILITATVQRQTVGLFVAEDRGQHELKGLSAPMTLYRVVRASGGGRRGGARALTPLVGREEELELLARRWDRARKGEGQLALIVGEPGLGKSRLMEEFHGRLGETPYTWVEWSSSQLLQNTPLHPIAEWGRQRFGADLPAEQRLADLEHTLQLVGLDPTEYTPLLAPLVDVLLPEDRVTKIAPEELRRRQMAAMTAWILAAARTQAIVLAFEDLHWADPTSLDLMRALAERGAQAPLLIIATARPEFRAPWSVRSHHSALSLSPLDSAQIAKMVYELSARHALPRDIVEGVSERTGGVPLFIEEVTRLLLERGEQGGAQAIPPTLQQSLAARLDRLGSARETAQIGAVLGRGFSYALVQSVAGLDEGALRSALERLAEADILFVEGDGAQATYRFKHALIQDAAYDSLLKSRRQALHAQAAEILRDSASPEPEAIAHHFTQAGLDDLAIEWWGKAGDQALRRSAFQEAIAHLGKAIAMADRTAAGTRGAEAAAPSSQRLKLQTDYGQALMWSKGFSSEETRAAFARVIDFGASGEDTTVRFAAYDAECQSSFMRGEYNKAQEIAETFLREAEAEGRATEAGAARRALGFVLLFQGNLRAARSILERALIDYLPERDGDTQRRFNRDTEVTSAAYLALAEWHLGEVERARLLIERSIRRANELGHAAAIANALFWRTILESRRDDVPATRLAAEAVLEVSENYGIKSYADLSRIYAAWARGRLQDPGVGAEELERVLSAFLAQGQKVETPSCYGMLAELEAIPRGAEQALARIDQGLAISEETGERITDSYLYRLRGDILLKCDPADPGPPENAYQTAIAIARQQGARSYELLASLALAKLYQSTARHADAHTVLAPALDGFASTSEMLEIGEGQALLAALAETDEVRADVSRRRQRTQLQVAYGNALIAARGLGALETAEAFSKARESATGNKDTPDRLAADYGLWGGSFIRGELSSMRAYAKDFLDDVHARPDSPEAGIANRIWGSTHHCAGEYAEALHHLKRALELFQPGRDDDLAFRFGLDAGVAAMACLALALWPLGEIDLAASLIQQMLARMASLNHVTTLAIGNSYAVQFAMLCRDRKRGKANASEFARLAYEHNLSQLRVIAMFFEGWAKAENDIFGGLEDMRRGAELLREQKVLFLDGLVKIALAETEARTADPGRGLAILDEALMTCERTGGRAFEAELYRVRGEILLKRDPSNPLPAEEALLTAVAVAKQQATRSFELRAALALAKLYQSTERPAEAHAVLVPALEDFSATPKMPEIGEAHALVAMLEEMDEVKAEAARRRRITQLHAAYGNAMILAYGYGARETSAAFERARDTATAQDGFERLSAQYGLWAGSFVRGELGAMRELSAAMLRDCERRPQSGEASIAHRMRGVTHWCAGEFAASRGHLEQATAIFDPERDGDLAFRFGQDPGIVATAYLAEVLWLLGEVGVADQRMTETTARAAKSGHAATSAYGFFMATQFELIRRNPDRAATFARSLIKIANEHQLTFWMAHSAWFDGWLEWRSGDRKPGLAAMRNSLARQAEQGLVTTFFETLLAEAEAEAGESDVAFCTINHALAASERTGLHWYDVETHRIRGEILLRGNSADTLTAEEAFQRAIAVAGEQGARSFQLRAALSLAKLYQSTNRLVDAQAVLSPALEGFSPTPEMPEIAEARALLAAIEAGAHVRRE